MWRKHKKIRNSPVDLSDNGSEAFTNLYLHPSLLSVHFPSDSDEAVMKILLCTCAVLALISTGASAADLS